MNRPLVLAALLLGPLPAQGALLGQEDPVPRVLTPLSEEVVEPPTTFSLGRDTFAFPAPRGSSPGGALSGSSPAMAYMARLFRDHARFLPGSPRPFALSEVAAFLQRPQATDFPVGAAGSLFELSDPGPRGAGDLEARALAALRRQAGLLGAEEGPLPEPPEPRLALFRLLATLHHHQVLSGSFAPLVRELPSTEAGPRATTRETLARIRESFGFDHLPVVATLDSEGKVRNAALAYRLVASRDAQGRWVHTDVHVYDPEIQQGAAPEEVVLRVRADGRLSRRIGGAGLALPEPEGAPAADASLVILRDPSMDGSAEASLGRALEAPGPGVALLLAGDALLARLDGGAPEGSTLHADLRAWIRDLHDSVGFDALVPGGLAPLGADASVDQVDAALRRLPHPALTRAAPFLLPPDLGLEDLQLSLLDADRATLRLRLRAGDEEVLDGTRRALARSLLLSRVEGLSAGLAAAGSSSGGALEVEVRLEKTAGSGAGGLRVELLDCRVLGR